MNNNNFETKKLASKTLKILNAYLQEYFQKTSIISDLLKIDTEKQDEENILKINDLLNERESIIQQYNKLNPEYKKLLNLLGGPIVAELKDLEQERGRVLKSIRNMEKQNIDKLNEIFNITKKNIKKIADGKRLNKTYENNQTFADGVFVDKRK